MSYNIDNIIFTSCIFPDFGPYFINRAVGGSEIRALADIATFAGPLDPGRQFEGLGYRSGFAGGKMALYSKSVQNAVSILSHIAGG